MNLLMTFCNVSYLPERYCLGVYNWDKATLKYRESSLKLFISANGKIWKQAYENKPKNIFAGINVDSLMIPIHNKQARYIRVQLNAFESLHLDQIEVCAA
jgi:hypothetical protein